MPNGSVIFRRHDYHQVGSALLLVLGLEQGAEDRQAAQNRDLAEGVGFLIVHQAGNHEALAFAQLDFVSARRVDKAGMVKPFNVTELV